MPIQTVRRTAQDQEVIEKRTTMLLKIIRFAQIANLVIMAATFGFLLVGPLQGDAYMLTIAGVVLTVGASFNVLFLHFIAIRPTLANLESPDKLIITGTVHRKNAKTLYVDVDGKEIVPIMLRARAPHLYDNRFDEMMKKGTKIEVHKTVGHGFIFDIR